MSPNVVAKSSRRFVGFSSVFIVSLRSCCHACENATLANCSLVKPRKERERESAGDRGKGTKCHCAHRSVQDISDCLADIYGVDNWTFFFLRLLTHFHALRSSLVGSSPLRESPRNSCNFPRRRRLITTRPHRSLIVHSSCSAPFICNVFEEKVVARDNRTTLNWRWRENC